MSAHPSQIRESIHVQAPVDEVYDAVSDPRNYARWSPESAGAVLSGVPPLRAGDRFTGRNRVWVPWTSRCTVVAAEPGRRFAFDSVIAGIRVARWTYEVEPESGGCVVTETWDDLRKGLLGLAIRPAGVFVGRGIDAASRNRSTMQATLARLKADLESRSARASGS